MNDRTVFEQKIEAMERSMDERQREVENKVTSTAIAVAKMSSKVDHIEKYLEDLVTKDRFAPVAYIAYGLAGGVLTTFIGAVTAMVFIK